MLVEMLGAQDDWIKYHFKTAIYYVLWRCCQSNRNSSPIGARRAKGPTSGRNILPLGQSGRASDFVSLTIDEVTLLVKMVVKTGMYRDELLQRFHPSKPQHCPLSSPKW